MPSTPINSTARMTVFIVAGFLLLITGIAAMSRIGWPAYLLMAAGVGLLLFNVLQMTRRRGGNE